MRKRASQDVGDKRRIETKTAPAAKRRELVAVETVHLIVLGLLERSNWVQFKPLCVLINAEVDFVFGH